MTLHRILAVAALVAASFPAGTGLVWAGETLGIAPSFSIGIDTFGLPSSLTILEEGEKKEEDLEVKQTARFLMIAAGRALYEGNLEEAMKRLEDGLKKDYFVMHQKRILSRVHFQAGRLDSALGVAREIAADTDATSYDKSRVEFLAAVERYLKISLDTDVVSYKVAATLKGDEKTRHRFITPVGVEADRFGRILQTSFGTNEVVVFTKGLEYDMKLSGILHPFDVTVDPDGSIYVTSFGSDRVHRYKRDGTSLGSFGQKGSGPGQFFGPEGIAVSPDRYLYVVDGGNHRVQKFTLDGKHLMTFGSRGSRPGEFLSPRSIVIQPVPKSDAYTILILSQDGHLLQRFDPYGNFLGVVPTADLSEPRDMDWSPDHGFLFCTGRGELLFMKEGADTLIRVMDEFGQPLKADGVNGLSLDEEAGLMYLADQTASELRVLRPATLTEQTLINITDLDFQHYPYVGVTFQVTTGSGDPVTGLSRRNFVVEEDNHRVVPSTVRPLTQTGPLNLIVHLDPSSAIDRRSVLVRTFLSSLSRELPSDFHLSIRKGRKILLEPTDNPYSIRKSLVQIDEVVSGSLVKDLYESIAAFKGMRGRRNILLITAREGDLSPEQFAPLILELTNHGISLFVLHLSDQVLPVLKTLCRRSGGSYRMLNETSISDMSFELASSKTGSYFLVYPSPYGVLQPNVSVDLVLRLFYLTDAVSDRIRYFAPQKKDITGESH